MLLRLVLICYMSCALGFVYDWNKFLPIWAQPPKKLSTPEGPMEVVEYEQEICLLNNNFDLPPCEFERRFDRRDFYKRSTKSTLNSAKEYKFIIGDDIQPSKVFENSFINTGETPPLNGENRETRQVPSTQVFSEARHEPNIRATKVIAYPITVTLVATKCIPEIDLPVCRGTPFEPTYERRMNRSIPAEETVSKDESDNSNGDVKEDDPISSFFRNMTKNMRDYGIGPMEEAAYRYNDPISAFFRKPTNDEETVEAPANESEQRSFYKFKPFITKVKKVFKKPIKKKTETRKAIEKLMLKIYYKFKIRRFRPTETDSNETITEPPFTPEDNIFSTTTEEYYDPIDEDPTEKPKEPPTPTVPPTLYEIVVPVENTTTREFIDPDEECEEIVIYRSRDVDPKEVGSSTPTVEYTTTETPKRPNFVVVDCDFNDTTTESAVSSTTPPYESPITHLETTTKPYKVITEPTTTTTTTTTTSRPVIFPKNKCNKTAIRGCFQQTETLLTEKPKRKPYFLPVRPAKSFLPRYPELYYDRPMSIDSFRENSERIMRLMRTNMKLAKQNRDDRNKDRKTYKLQPENFDHLYNFAVSLRKKRPEI